MKALDKHRKVIFVIVFVVVILLVLILWLMSNSDRLLQQTSNGTTQLEANKGNTSLVVNRDGRVEYRNGQNVFTDYWTADQTRAFFEYYDSVYADEAVISGNKASFTYDNDELLDHITDETENGGGNGGNGPGDDVSEYFNTPRPSGAGQSSATPRATTNPQEQPWCLYWRLSYCVIAYTPSPSGTPVAGENIRIPNCDQNLDTGKTNIGDEQCFTPVTPTPLPN